MFNLLFNAWGVTVLIHQRDAYYSVTVLSIGVMHIMLQLCFVFTRLQFSSETLLLGRKNNKFWWN